MATNVEFTKELRPALIQAKSKCLEKVSTGEGIRRVSGFFSELESAAESLQDKFCQQSRFEKVHNLLPSAGVVAKGLQKMHQKIIRRLHVKPKMKNHYLHSELVLACLRSFSSVYEAAIWKDSQPFHYNFPVLWYLHWVAWAF